MIPFREVSQGVILCRRGSFIIFLPRRDEGTKNCSGSATATEIKTRE